MGRFGITSNIQGGQFDPRSVFFGQGVGLVLRIGCHPSGQLWLSLIDTDACGDFKCRGFDSWIVARARIKSPDVKGLIRAFESFTGEGGYGLDICDNAELKNALKSKTPELQKLIDDVSNNYWHSYDFAVNDIEVMKREIDYKFNNLDI